MPHLKRLEEVYEDLLSEREIKHITDTSLDLRQASPIMRKTYICPRSGIAFPFNHILEYVPQVADEDEHPFDNVNTDANSFILSPVFSPTFKQITQIYSDVPKRPENPFANNFEDLVLYQSEQPKSKEGLNFNLWPNYAEEVTLSDWS